MPLRETQREQILSRIISGKTFCQVGKKIYIVRQPSRLIKYRAQRVYDRVFYKNRFQPWISSTESESLALGQGLIKNEDLADLPKLKKRLDQNKIALFQNMARPSQTKPIRVKISAIKKELSRIENARRYFEYVSPEWYAGLARLQYIIFFSLLSYRNKRVKPSALLLERIIKRLNEQTISLAEYRELARTEPWRSYWNVHKGNIFGGSVIDWSEEQRTLVLFSKIYDNAYSHPDCPSDDVIKDDDSFDGWSLWVKEKEKKERRGEDKFEGADAVFLPAKNIDEAREVEAMNTTESSFMKKQRMAELARKGKIKEGNFADQKLEQKMEAQKQLVDKIKRR